MSKHIDIVFDAPPGHEAPRFIEVEDDTGASVNTGEWVERDDGYWVLRFTKNDLESPKKVEATQNNGPMGSGPYCGQGRRERW